MVTILIQPFLQIKDVNLEFKSKDQLYQKIDSLPTGPDWRCQEIIQQGDCRGYSHIALVFPYFMPIFTLYILFSFHFYKGTMVIRRLSLHLWAYQHNSHMG